jgi:hypothetical protein
MNVPNFDAIFKLVTQLYEKNYTVTWDSMTYSYRIPETYNFNQVIPEQLNSRLKSNDFLIQWNQWSGGVDISKTWELVYVVCFV